MTSIIESVFCGYGILPHNAITLKWKWFVSDSNQRLGKQTGGAENTPRDLVCRAMTEPPLFSVVSVVTNMADQ